MSRAMQQLLGIASGKYATGVACPGCNVVGMKISGRNVSGVGTAPIGAPADGRICDTCGHIFAVENGKGRNFRSDEMAAIRGMGAGAERIRERQLEIVRPLFG